MLEGFALGYLHQAVGFLLIPVLACLFLSLAAVIFEVGMTCSELTVVKSRLSALPHNVLSNYAVKRIDRVDVLARSGPILGLMGTLIPLGPGLTAMSQGDLTQLASAIAIAFDTTVIGLLVGLSAFIIGKHRRRFYEVMLAETMLSDSLQSTPK